MINYQFSIFNFKAPYIVSTTIKLSPGFCCLKPQITNHEKLFSAVYPGWGNSFVGLRPFGSSSKRKTGSTGICAAIVPGPIVCLD